MLLKSDHQLICDISVTLELCWLESRGLQGSKYLARFTAASQRCLKLKLKLLYCYTAGDEEKHGKHRFDTIHSKNYYVCAIIWLIRLLIMCVGMLPVD